MKYGIALILTLICLSGCTRIAGNLTDKDIQALAPDVPAAPAAVQDKAAGEVDGGQCPALSDLAASCMITRDESRNLSGEKVK